MAVEYVATTRLGEKGQLTIPKPFREELGLGKGAPFTVLRMGEALVLLSEQKRYEELCARVTKALSRSGAPREDVLAALPKVRKHIFADYYASLAAKVAAPPKRRGRPAR